MDAPEKIYYAPHGDMRENAPITDNDIEYVRKDAFIKRAAEWLSKHAKKYYFNKEKYLGTDELVEDFKIAMEL